MEYLIVSVRILTIFPLLLIMTLIMGKRQVGELTVIDFIIAITIGNVVGADIVDTKINHGIPLLAVVMLSLFQVVVSWGRTKSRLFNHWVTFEPTIVIQNGQILKSHLKKIRFTLDELFELLRLKGIFDVNEVEFAIVEPNGQISVLKKSQYDTPSAQDLGIQTKYKGLATPLIVEGKPFAPGLQFVGLKESDLLSELQVQGINSFTEVFFASLNSEGNLHLSLYQEPGKEQVFRF